MFIGTAVLQRVGQGALSKNKKQSAPLPKRWARGAGDGSGWKVSWLCVVVVFMLHQMIFILICIDVNLLQT